MSKTQFSYPVDKMCGKISRHSRVIHACTASGKQITYLQGDRNYDAHPVTPDESATKDLFKRRIAVVSARLNRKAETYAADMAAYHEQLKEKDAIQSFRAYIWSLVKAEITE